MGATAQLESVSELSMKSGRLWTDAEDQRHAHVCAIGHDTAEELFGTADPIGKDVNVGLRPLYRDRRSGKTQAAVWLRQKSSRQRRLFPARRLPQSLSRKYGHVHQRQIRRPAQQSSGRRRDSRSAPHTPKGQSRTSPTTSISSGPTRSQSSGINSPAA